MTLKAIKHTFNLTLTNFNNEIKIYIAALWKQFCLNKYSTTLA